MWETLATIFGGGVGGVLLKAMWDGFNRRTELSQQGQLSNRRETRDDFNELIDRLQLQIDGLMKQNADLRIEVTGLSKLSSRAVTWIGALEEKLEAGKIPYRKWTDTV